MTPGKFIMKPIAFVSGLKLCLFAASLSSSGTMTRAAAQSTPGSVPSLTISRANQDAVLTWFGDDGVRYQ